MGTVDPSRINVMAITAATPTNVDRLATIAAKAFFFIVYLSNLESFDYWPDVCRTRFIGLLHSLAQMSNRHEAAPCDNILLRVASLGETGGDYSCRWFFPAGRQRAGRRNPIHPVRLAILPRMAIGRRS
jgi:hypothetical protein